MAPGEWGEKMERWKNTALCLVACLAMVSGARAGGNRSGSQLAVQRRGRTERPMVTRRREMAQERYAKRRQNEAERQEELRKRSMVQQQEEARQQLESRRRFRSQQRSETRRKGGLSEVERRMITAEDRHRRRLERLERIRERMARRQSAKALNRVDEAVRRENLRHGRYMERLQVRNEAAFQHRDPSQNRSRNRDRNRRQDDEGAW